MATTGSVRTNTRFGYVQLFWSLQSQNVATNTSTIAYELTINRTNNISSTAPKNYSIAINGVNVASGTTTIGGVGTKTIYTGSTTIPHNADGSKVFTFSFSQQIDITYSGSWVGTITGSGSDALNTIPRATQPTLNVASQTMGQAITISLPRATASFTHNLWYSFGQATGTIGNAIGTSTSWTIPLGLANQIGNATSGVGTIHCDTYNGATLIGTKTVAFTAIVPDDAKPYFTSFTTTEAVAGLAAKFGGYVQNKSKINVKSVGIGVYASLITHYSHKFLNYNYQSAEFVSEPLSQSGTIPITSTVTDTRGRTGTITNNITVIPYNSPKINYFRCYRASSNGTADTNGRYLKCEFSFDISPVNNKNDKRYMIQYKLKTATEWTTLVDNTSVYTASTTYTSTNQVLIETNSYDVRFYIADYFSTAEYIADVATTFTIMNWRSTGKGMAIGKVSEKDALEIALPVEVNGQPLQTGAITVLCTSQQPITTANYTKCNLNSTLGQAGNNLTLSNNEITCQKSGYVEVSGMISLTGGLVAGDNIYGFVFRTHSGGETALNIGAITSQGQWTTIVINPVITAVNAGDKITLQVLNSNARGTMGNADNVAWMNKLTVKYVG